MKHAIGLVDYPVTMPDRDEPQHRLVCTCRIAFVGETYGRALGKWGDHAKRIKEGIGH